MLDNTRAKFHSQLVNIVENFGLAKFFVAVRGFESYYVPDALFAKNGRKGLRIWHRQHHTVDIEIGGVPRGGKQGTELLNGEGQADSELLLDAEGFAAAVVNGRCEVEEAACVTAGPLEQFYGERFLFYLHAELNAFQPALQSLLKIVGAQQ